MNCITENDMILRTKMLIFSSGRAKKFIFISGRTEKFIFISGWTKMFILDQEGLK